MQVFKYILVFLSGWAFTFGVAACFLNLEPYLFGENIRHELSFDKQEWKTIQTDLLKSKRSAMTDDLLKYHLAIGDNKAYITNLLGQPDKSNDKQISYCIGRWNGVLNPPEWIVLDVKNDTIIDLKIKQ